MSIDQDEHNSVLFFQNYEYVPFIEKINIDLLADLVDLCQVESHIRNISLLIYMSFRFMGFTL